MFERIKRLWKLSGEKSPAPFPKEWSTFLARQTNVNQETVITFDTPPKKMATVLEDDPLDIFPSDNPEENKDKDITE